jgi:glyoxylate/hydroxypyruvate reductase A
MSSSPRIAVALSSMNSEAWIAPLREACAAVGVAAQFEVFDGRPLGARYAVVWLPPPEVFTVERGLRAVFNAGAGVERLLAMPGLPPELPILRLVDAGMAPKMAEYVCFYIARITRGLHRFGGPSAVRDWNFDRPRGTPPTVGVLGLGAIGARIAQAARLFGYPVRGWSRTPKALAGIESFAGRASLDEFLSGTRILVDTLPLTDETRDLLDRTHLSKLPAGSHLINVGRAATIVDADLLALLDSGHLASAVLDVFRTEPLPDEHPFWRHPKVTVTPHLSGPTPREPAARQIAEALAALEAGTPVETVPGYVDRRRGY